MGLKNFHILFITLATLATLGFGLWCFLTEAGRETGGSTVMGSISLVVAVGLVIYGYRFLRKLKREGID